MWSAQGSFFLFFGHFFATCLAVSNPFFSRRFIADQLRTAYLFVSSTSDQFACGKQLVLCLKLIRALL